jgi:opacity protein-like surface antigen
MRAKTLDNAIPRLLAFATLAVLLASPATYSHAQQPYVGRYDVYTGFADIDSPMLGLNEQGFHAQAGINPRGWYSFGADYSEGTGSQILTTNLLPTALQTTINAAQAGYIAQGALPANYRLAVPTDAFTQTFAFGPQLDCRRYSKLTLFFRPSLGALRERAVPHAQDAFQVVIVGQLAPAGFKLDWTGFYGVGGGAEVAVNKHIGIRGQMDVVYNHPFNDILADGRWTYRYSVGPSFHFGRNVAAGDKKSH